MQIKIKIVIEMAKKRHHYIPQYYLSGFSTPGKTKKIWVYSKDGSEPFETNIINVGVEGHFYSAVIQYEGSTEKSIEDHLAQNIEGPANPVLKKLRNRIRISSKDKYILARYLVGMLTRVPTNRDRVQKDIPEMVAHARKSTQTQFEKALKSNPGDRERLIGLQQQTSNLFGKMETELINELSMPHFDETLITSVFNKNLALFVNCPGFTFPTSDNPFCFLESEGLLHGQYVFPISSNVVLLGRPKTAGKDSEIRYVPMDKEANFAVNRIIVATAKRYVYHSANVDWLKDIIREVNTWSSW
ncbi:MAG: DUF4238 domain-containing protein [Chitinophagaceae bacterium]